MDIIKAHIEHLEDLAPLFNGYRMFYKQESDMGSAKTFLKERIQNKESIIYMAYIK